MNDLMIDLETLGTGSEAAFISIGAVFFDRKTGQLGKEFFLNVSIQDNLDKGRKVTEATLRWWLKQNPKALASSMANPEHLENALVNLSSFVKDHGRGAVKVWGNGSSFDISILEHAYEGVNLKAPWQFWNVRDCRTIKDVATPFVDAEIFKLTEGLAHNALDDAKHQAKWVSACFTAFKF